VAFTPLPRPLSACRVALVTTAGLRVRGDRPLGPADQWYRFFLEAFAADEEVDMEDRRRVRGRLDPSGDPSGKAAAFGVAR
jgi:hypothetical protein